MKVIDTDIPEVKIIEPSIFFDERGWFTESWNQQKFNALVKNVSFVQDNHSVSAKGVLRGLHYQLEPYAQGKLVRVIKGSAYDVAVDIRPGSATYGQHVGVILSDENKRMLWIPEGFAHGFLALEDDTHFLYKTTSGYNKASERSLHWDSKELAINWPLRGELIVSEKDEAALDFVPIEKATPPAINENSLINLLDFKVQGDDRGSLVSLEANKNIPFEIKRVYYIFETKQGVSRGFHAHKALKQVVIALSGSCTFLLDDGDRRESVVLNSSKQGLLVNAYTWREMHDFSEDCVLMVLASEHYDEADYVRDYQVFKNTVNR